MSELSSGQLGVKNVLETKLENISKYIQNIRVAARATKCLTNIYPTQVAACATRSLTMFSSISMRADVTNMFVGSVEAQLPLMGSRGKKSCLMPLVVDLLFVN